MVPGFRIAVLALGIAAAGSVMQPAQAQQRGTVVLVAGAGGASPNDFLVRNEATYRGAGLETVIAVGASDAASAAARAQGRGKVYGVGMSAGGTHLAQAIAAGARFDKVVFVSAGYLQPERGGGVGEGVIAALGSPARLPPALAVHNRNDGCILTPPEGVAAFVNWTRGKARARWVNSSQTQSPPCRALSPHGFLGADAAATSAILGFLR